MTFVLPMIFAAAPLEGAGGILLLVGLLALGRFALATAALATAGATHWITRGSKGLGMM